MAWRCPHTDTLRTRARTLVPRCPSWFLSFRLCCGVLQKCCFPLHSNPPCYPSCVLVNLCVCVVLTSRFGEFADHRARFPCLHLGILCKSVTLREFCSARNYEACAHRSASDWTKNITPVEYTRGCGFPHFLRTYPETRSSLTCKNIWLLPATYDERNPSNRSHQLRVVFLTALGVLWNSNLLAPSPCHSPWPSICVDF